MKTFEASKYYNSSAKINLGLKIINKRSDGFHNLDTIFIELELHDKIYFSKSNKFSLTTSCKGLKTDNSNIVTKAYNLLCSNKIESKPNYSIHLDKKIPMGSGLGGGSSNAATTLKALNTLWDCGYTNSELSKLGASLGADVPFFINGGIQHGTGIGDILTPLKNKIFSKLKILLVIPNIHISTQWAYERLNFSLQSTKKGSKLPPLTSPVTWRLFENDFERVIRSTYPEIDEIKSQLYKCGAIYAGMSGSGSTVFGIYDNNKLLQNSFEEFTHCQSYITSPVY